MIATDNHLMGSSNMMRLCLGFNEFV